jgi:hypothetical protein
MFLNIIETEKILSLKKEWEARDKRILCKFCVNWYITHYSDHCCAKENKHEDYAGNYKYKEEPKVINANKDCPWFKFGIHKSI